MYDVAIVGGGVAGPFLASRLSARRKIVLIDRSNKFTEKDSGIVSKRIFDFFPESKIVKTDIKKMELISPSGVAYPVESDTPIAHILERKKFFNMLRKAAARRADIISANATGVRYYNDHVVVETSEGPIEAKIVAGCDGANSVVRRSAGIDSPRMACGIMVKTKNKLQGDVNVFFNKYYSPDFFSWIIPQNSEYGLMTAVRPKAYLEYFSRKLYLPRGQAHACMIPFSYTKSYAFRTILAGDACGQNKPLTGGGIVFSLGCALHAANIINDALEQKRYDTNFLSYYERYWKQEYAWEIEKQFMIRLIYRKMTNQEIEKALREFGPLFSGIDIPDYDKLTRLWTKFPRLKMLKFLLPRIPGIFS